MLILMTKKIFLQFYAKKFCLTKPMGALWKFFCYKAGCFCYSSFYVLPIYILDPDRDRINFGPDLDPSCLTLL